MITYNEFMKNLESGDFLVLKCKKCGTLNLPPKALCQECFDSELECIKIKNEGKILSYTTIHVPSTKFKDRAPYTSGVAELEGRIQITGVVLTEPEIGKKVRIETENGTIVFR